MQCTQDREHALVHFSGACNVIIASQHREWPIPEKESKQKRPFGQYKAPKGHKYEKEKQKR